MEKPEGVQPESIIDYITFSDEIHIIPDGTRGGRRTIVAAVSGIDPEAYEAIRKEAELIREQNYAGGGTRMGQDVVVPLAIMNLLDEHDLRFSALLICQLHDRKIPIWPTYRSTRR